MPGLNDDDLPLEDLDTDDIFFGTDDDEESDDEFNPDEENDKEEY